MSNIYDDDNIRIDKIQLGPYGTNTYIVVCNKTSESLVVDAPAEADTIIKSLRGTKPRYILLTHNHMDHIGAMADLRERLKIPLATHASNNSGLSSSIEIPLSDDDTITIGALTFTVLHTPGHTPGGICFHTGNHLFSGDTLFPGGPGKTWGPDAFRQILESIKTKILVLPDDTHIYPGHGEITMLEKERAEIEIFNSRPHNPKLCGDVLWLSS